MNVVAGGAGELAADLTWPVTRLGEALGRLASEAGLVARPASYPRAPAVAGSAAERARFVPAAAEWLGVEAAPQELRYGEIAGALRGWAPLLVELASPSVKDDGAPPRYLAVLRVRGRRVTVVVPDGRHGELSLESVLQAVDGAVKARHGSGFADVDRLLTAAAVAGRRRDRAARLLLKERLGEAPVLRTWLLRLPPSAPFRRQLRAAGLFGLVGRYLAVYLPKRTLWLAAWWVLWRGALAGQIDWGWLTAWVLMLLTNLPLRLLEPWYSTQVAIGVGWLLKRRLLAGVLRLDPDEIRHQGTGQLLGRAIESEAAENLTLAAGVVTVAATIDALFALAILWQGSGGPPHALLLVVWLGISLLLVRRYLAQRTDWTSRRLDGTHQLVEQMVGHSTRLVQEHPGELHTGEDAALEGYVERSRTMDRSAALLATLVPGGFLVSSLLLLTPTVVLGGFSTTRLAVAVGGMLFGLASLEHLILGLLGGADASVVWRKVLPLFRAARRPRTLGLPELALSPDGDDAAGSNGDEERVGDAGKVPMLDASDLAFTYGGRREPVLDGCTITVARGDRVLLEGSSGCGKSTLLALLLGLRRPDSGLLLLDGLDMSSLGEEGWRRRVAAAPQFHENHVFLGTFAFNLLLGRDWPPGREDFVAAGQVCHELGLGELVARMPGGLLQPVGETGWQLSHGERSRLYIARALLQRSDVLAFDESFAALDPENLERALQVVLERAETVIVVAHP